MKLTVFYDGHFWVAVIQWQDQGALRACRHIFGSSEPSDPQIEEFSRDELFSLLGTREDTPFNVSLEGLEERVNPKRMARLVAKEMRQKGLSSAAQETLRKELEQNKKERRTLSKAQREEEKEKRYFLRREKAKKKQRGH